MNKFVQTTIARNDTPLIRQILQEWLDNQADDMHCLNADDHEDRTLLADKIDACASIQEAIELIEKAEQVIPRSATIHPNRIDIHETDNRDVDTTWLWITNNCYIEVNIPELIENALDNLPQDDRSRIIPNYSYKTAPEFIAQGWNIAESIHQSFDGWSAAEQVVIGKYLRDIDVANQISLKDHNIDIGEYFQVDLEGFTQENG